MTYKVVTTEDLTLITEQVAGIAGPAGTNGTNGARGRGYDITSNTSRTVTNGATVIFTTFDRDGNSSQGAYFAGAQILVSKTGSTTEYFYGYVSSLVSTTGLNVQVDSVSIPGGFTTNTWSFQVLGATGATGPQGSSGVIAVDTGELTNTGTSTSAQLGLATTGTAGTYTKVTTDTFGRVSVGSTLASTDIPDLNASKITAGTFDTARIPNTINGTSIPTSATLLTSTSTIDKAYGGTGSTYGSLMVGHSQLNAIATKNANDTTPEAVFRSGTANSTIQYFNVDADTMYFFEGFIQLGKTSTSSVINTSLLYVATGSTSALTEQSARLQVQYNSATAFIGAGGANATATTAASVTTALTTIYCTFRGFIRTNATTAGRINIAQWLDTAGASAPTWTTGSYLNLYKVGSGNAQNFGNWTS